LKKKARKLSHSGEKHQEKVNLQYICFNNVWRTM